MSSLTAKAAWRSRLALGMWLLGILFPAIWLRQFSEAYRLAFDRVFGAEWTHIFMHLALYAVLGVLLILVLHIPLKPRGLLQLALLILAAGVLQEAFQAASQGASLLQTSFLSAAVFDWVIDLTGGLSGFGVLYVARILKRPQRKLPPNNQELISN